MSLQKAYSVHVGPVLLADYLSKAKGEGFEVELGLVAAIEGLAVNLNLVVVLLFLLLKFFQLKVQVLLIGSGISEEREIV